MTNREIAQAFANGATKGRSGNGTLIISGNVIYSYGDHWPLAYRDSNGTAHVNDSKYSVTTSKHKGLVAGHLSYAGFQIDYVSCDMLRQIILNRG